MLRTGKTPQYGARLRLSPRTSNMAARLRPARTAALTVSTAIFPTATLRWRSVSPFGKVADLTDKTKLV
jgi:hypothetical protein